MSKDLYKILGVNRSSSADELKRAYRKKAIENHPDRNKDDKGAEDRFKDVNEAYSILSDSKKRSLYDQYGYEALQRGMGSGQGGSPFGNMGGGAQGFSSFSDIFEEAFNSDSIFENFFGGGAASGGQRSRKQARSGEDLQYELEISLKDAFSGTDYNFQVTKRVSCEECKGSGAEQGTDAKRCSDCGGMGQIRQNKGIFSISTTCPTCRGKGQVIEHPCYQCSGAGIVQARKKISAKIPPGIADGQSIRMNGEGHAGSMGAAAGDLYLHIRVKQNDYFVREENDLHCETHISIPQAILGDSLQLRNVNDETIKVTIPPGTQAESTLRIKGKGMPRLQRRGERGDLLLRVHVRIPKNLDRQTTDLYKEIAKLQGSGEDEIELTPRTGEKKSFWQRFGA